MSFTALADCNNFFVSCERLFNPTLRGKPVVVLSSNEGCILARSNEAKAIGIPMGAPFFEWADFFERQKGIALASNFSLYGDLSSRVMQIIEEMSPDLEIYSVDEAFFPIDSIEEALTLRSKILQWTGLPVSIGIAPTKTLAKVAGDLAKKAPRGVFELTDPAVIESVLDTLPVEEVWGIGRKTGAYLRKRGIRTAGHFRSQDDLWIRQHLSIVGVRMAWELRGEATLSVEEAPRPKKSLMTSRTFGRQLKTFDDVRKALSHLAARGATKLREEKQLACAMQVFIQTGIYEGHEQYCHTFPIPTDFTPTILEAVEEALSMIHRAGLGYKRAGVLFVGLVPRCEYQQDLFVAPDPAKETRRRQICELMDSTNDRFGYDILKWAAEGTETSWGSKRNNRSPRYTTHWEELLTIRI